MKRIFTFSAALFLVFFSFHLKADIPTLQIENSYCFRTSAIAVDLSGTYNGTHASLTLEKLVTGIWTVQTVTFAWTGDNYDISALNLELGDTIRAKNGTDSSEVVTFNITDHIKKPAFTLTDGDLINTCWNEELEFSASYECTTESPEFHLLFNNVTISDYDDVLPATISYIPPEDGTLKLLAIYGIGVGADTVPSEEHTIINLIEDPGTYYPLIQDTALPYSEGEIDLMTYFESATPTLPAQTSINLDLGFGQKNYNVYGDATGFYKFILPYDSVPTNNTTTFDTKAEGVFYNYNTGNIVKFYYGVKEDTKTCYNEEQTKIFVLRDKIFVPAQFFCSTDEDPYTILIDKDFTDYYSIMDPEYSQIITFDKFEMSIEGTEIYDYTFEDAEKERVKFYPSDIDLNGENQTLIDLKATIKIETFFNTGIATQPWSYSSSYNINDEVQYGGYVYRAIRYVPSYLLPPLFYSYYWTNMGLYNPGSTESIGVLLFEYAANSFYIFKANDNGLLDLEDEYCYSEDSIEIIESNGYTITKITEHDLTDQLDYITNIGNTWEFRTKDVFNSNVNSQAVSWDFYYEDNRGCANSNQINVTINPRPTTNYTVDNVCFGDSIKFIGNTDYPNNTDSLSWEWDFDDSGSLALTDFRDNDIPVLDGTNGGNTTGTYVEPIHNYSNAGKYSALLKVTSENGCVTDSTFVITIGSYPKVSFTPTGFVETNPTSFENFSQSELFDPIDTIIWNFDDPTSIDNIVGQSNIQPTDHQFDTTGVHDVALTMITETGCESSKIVKVPIFPLEIVLTNNTYVAQFNDLNHHWIESGEFDKGLPSGWKHNTVAGPFNVSPNTEGMIWQTGEPADGIINENSWVESPCFDISGLDFPLLSIDIYQSVEEGRDGAALQYTLDDGVTWSLLGDKDEGVNWYDTRGIVSNPGNQTLTTGVGWSLDANEWKTARYTLDDLMLEIADSAADFVRFRVAYSSDAGNAPEVEAQGFAFDNFTLTSRNRVVMMEQFVNSAHDKTLQENEEAWLDNFLIGRDAEVVDMRYHNFISHDYDPLFDINRPDISARSMEYGATMAQLTMVDGFYRCLANSEVEARAYYKERTLTDISFDIDVSHTVSGGNLLITADITKIKNSLLIAGTQKAVVRMAIVQHGYEHNGETYNNVVVELLPNGEGNVVESIPADFAANESLTVKGTWTPNVTTIGNEFRLVVYVQGIWGVDEIHQTWFEDSIAVPQVTVTKSAESEKSEGSNSFTIYPSPVKEKLNISWYETLENPIQWKLVTMTGSVVKQGITPAGQIREEIDTYQMNKGIYLLVTEDLTSLEVEQRKILIIK